MATRPLLVLVYVTSMGFFLPRILSESSSRSTLMAKGASAVLVTVGVTAMAFS